MPTRLCRNPKLSPRRERASERIRLDFHDDLLEILCIYIYLLVLRFDRLGKPRSSAFCNIVIVDLIGEHFVFDAVERQVERSGRPKRPLRHEP